MALNAKIGHTLLTWDVFAHPENLEQGIREIAELGFAGTETGGRLYEWWENHHPGRLKRVLEEAGIPMVALFQSGEWIDPEAEGKLLEDAGRWAATIKELGGEMLMLVPGRRSDGISYGLDDFKQMADVMNRAGWTARTTGISAAMHPHWGTAVETRLEIELLLSLLDPAVVGFAPDTGQIAKGGSNPLTIVDRWGNRVRYVHLKDLSPEWDEMRRAGVPLRSPEGYVEIGQGTVDFLQLMRILDAADYRGWLMAELDEAKRPARESATLSRDYLRTLGFNVAAEGK